MLIYLDLGEVSRDRIKMERMGAELLTTTKMSVVEITSDLPKDMYGIVVAPLIVDDTHPKVLPIVSRIVSVMRAEPYKKISLRDRDRLTKFMRFVSEYIKPITMYLANEAKLMDLDLFSLVVYTRNNVSALSVIVYDRRSSFDYMGEDSRSMAIIISDTKLRHHEIENVLSTAQDLADFFGSRIGFRVPNITSVDDVRILYVATEHEDSIRIKLREEYGRPVVIRVPLERPCWNLDDMPTRVREEIEVLVVDPIKSGAKYAPRGIAIVGPPGVGKSVAAEAIANALGKYIARITPSTYRSMWYGMTERLLHKLFYAIKKRRDTVVVVDDADFLVQRIQAIHEAYIAEVNVWLNILQDPSKPITIMTTNVPNLMDYAILRPGRIDIVIIMGYPDRAMRIKIVKRAAKRYGITISDDLAEEIADITRWFSAAELDALVRMSASKGRGKIDREVVWWARRRFNVAEFERRHVQENLRSYASKLPGLSILYVPKESEI